VEEDRREKVKALMLEQCFEIPAAVRDAKNEDIRILDAVDNDVPINGIASSAES
jgi:hypothetical protein